MKLDDTDRTLLALLESGPLAGSDLAADIDSSERDVQERLRRLADNGLVYGLGDGRYERTESGRRVLAGSPAGAADNQMDTPADVESVLAEADPPPDEAQAVRDAYALVRYWGSVTTDGILDAVYSETPAGYDTADRWWEEAVRPRLAALPDVEPPADDGDPWRYAETPEVETVTADGRRVLDEDDRDPVYGSVKHALASFDLDGGEREAVRAAFALLRERDEATEREIGEAVYPSHEAGYPSVDAWWDEVVRDAFGALPGVERIDGDRWRYGEPHRE